MEITKNDFLEWKQNEVTRTVFKALRKQREDWKEGFIRGEFGNPQYVRGKAELVLELLEMNYESLEELFDGKK